MINSESIIKMLEIQFNKDIKDIDEKEYDDVKSINIERLDVNGAILDVDYEDLLNFKNLEELNVFDCMINKELISIVIKMQKLNSFSAYSCDFVDGTLRLFDSVNFNKLVFDNCLGLYNSIIENVEKLTVKNTKLKEVKNITMLRTDNIKNFEFHNINTLIVKEGDFDSSLLSNKDIRKISIINEREEIIKEYTK